MHASSHLFPRGCEGAANPLAQVKRWLGIPFARQQIITSNGDFPRATTTNNLPHDFSPRLPLHLFVKSTTGRLSIVRSVRPLPSPPRPSRPGLAGHGL